MKKIRVLFVCLGNICRSPLGAAILKNKVNLYGMAGQVEVDSCGTSNYHIGGGADPRTIAIALQHGVPMAHCARQLTADDLQDFDFIFAMDKTNYQNVMRLAHRADMRQKIRLIRDFDPEGKGGEVPDPYHGGEKDFQDVYEMLDRSAENFIAFLRKEFSSN